MRHCVLIAYCIVLLMLNASWSVDTQAFEIQKFTTPVKTEAHQPKYPRQALGGGWEGWVRIRAMVSSDGEPYDIVVEDSVGLSNLVKEAVKAVEKTRYTPAEYDGIKVHSAIRLINRFEATDVPSYSPEYLNSYAKAVEYLQSSDEVRTREELGNLIAIARTLDEYYLYWLIRARYEQNWWSPQDQLRSVKKALGYETVARRGNSEQFAYLVQDKLILELELNHLVGALETIDQMRQIGYLEEDTLAKLDAQEQKILSVQTAGAPIEVKANLDEDGYWGHDLSRNDLTITDVDGEIERLVFHCLAGRFQFAYADGQDYRVGNESGACWLRLSGSPYTSFVLKQL